MEKIEIDLSSKSEYMEVVETLGRLYFDSSSAANIVCELMERHKTDAEFLSSPIYTRFYEDYSAKNMEYMKYKDMFEKTIVRILAHDINASVYNWSLSFNDYSLTIEYQVVNK